MRRTKHIFNRLVVVATVLALSAAACGDSSSNDASNTSGSSSTAASGTSATTAGKNCKDKVYIGAVWPQSGPFAFAGQASLVGANAAAADINSRGGIKSLCGAQVVVESRDAGATAQDAASAVEAMLAARKDTSVMIGSWLSSLTLSATEVSEREGIPWLSDSFADEVTTRSGFTHVYSVAPPSSLIKDLLLQAVDSGFATAGIPMKTVALVGDNTAAAVALQDALAAEFKKRNVDVAVSERWAPGIKDASGIATKIEAKNVDAIFLISFAYADVQLVTNALQSRKVTAPVIQNGGQGVLPAWQSAGNSIIGMSTFVTANPVKGSSAIAATLAKDAGESYARQDHLVGYLLVELAAAAIDKAGSIDHDKINTVLKTTTFTDPAIVDAVATDSISFAKDGRVAKPFGVLAQWQLVDGKLVPCTVWPEKFAVCKPAWKAKS